MMGKIMLIVLCLFVSFQASFAILCYNCTDCNDPFVKIGIQVITCNGKCSKKSHVADSFVAVGKTADRGCAEDTTRDPGCSHVGIFGLNSFDCLCSTDNCNTSGQLTFSFMVTLIAVLFSCVITTHQNLLHFFVK